MLTPWFKIVLRIFWLSDTAPTRLFSVIASIGITIISLSGTHKAAPAGFISYDAWALLMAVHALIAFLSFRVRRLRFSSSLYGAYAYMLMYTLVFIQGGVHPPLGAAFSIMGSLCWLIIRDAHEAGRGRNG